jgi:undecaprenyl-diphosphatase
MEPHVQPATDVRYERRADELPESLAAAGVLLVAGVVAGRGVPEVEERAFRALYRLPSWLEPVLWPPMQMGSLWGPFIAGGLAWRRWRSWRPALGAVVAGVVSWQLAKAVKGFVRRGRPIDELTDVVRRMGTPKDGLGFVSGHSAVVFSIVTVLSPYMSRRGRWLLRLLGLVVATARVHVGAHLPVDTLGGASLGILVGHLWRFAVGDPAVDGTGSSPVATSPFG